MRPDDEPGTDSGETLEQDFSVYVIPARQEPAQTVGADEPIARLAPTIGMVGIFLALGILADAVLFASMRDRNHFQEAWYAHFAFALVTTLLIFLALAPGFLAQNHYAELYPDRLVVRNGSRESAAPLEAIESIVLLPSPSDRSNVLVVLQYMTAFGTSASYRSPDAIFSSHGPDSQILRRQQVHFAYMVKTVYGSIFWIPMLPNADDFVQQVMAWRSRRLQTHGLQRPVED